MNYLPQAIIDQVLQDATAKARLCQLDTERHAPRCRAKKSAVLNGGSHDSNRWRLWWECDTCGGKSDSFILLWTPPVS